MTIILKKTHTSAVLTVAAISALALTSCAGGRSVDAYCGVLQDHSSELQELEQQSDNPGALISEGIDSMVTMFEEAAEVAPEEISSETETMAEAFGEISALDLDMENLMSMDEAEQAEVEQQFADLEEQFSDMDALSERWGAYTEENCDVSGLDL